ncbi:Helitron helicase-like protein [Phytophthora palmivora]|uniref:Helitron helicase-like protein n=1 Tax=Phytophthora palmivora TaxID=4796 RepID=A0A2P4YAW7_9STRA|nr:Helitron helicase-like protein [Phytophthora palmivora]
MAEDKYPTYKRRRRPEGILSHKGKKYDCHISVGVCATNKAVKYIYKYVYKGSDMATITIEGEEIQSNEILQYLLGGYISPVEACMRLFGFPTQGSSYAVVNLPIHLEGMRLVTYRDHAATPQLQNLVRRGDRTKLTAFFNLCTQDSEGTADLLYKDVPVKYRWNDRLKYWVPYRKYVASLGRLVHVSRQDLERFYLRLLLCHLRSPKSVEDIRTVNGVVYDTFHGAALAVGYLENDQEWEECLAEAVSFKMPSALRQLLGIILVYSLPNHASALWDRFKKDLSEDFFGSIQERDAQNNIDRDEEVSWRMAEYKCLMWLADYLISN